MDPGTAQAPIDGDSGVSLLAVSEPSRRVSSLAELLGMPLTLLSRLCDEGRIPSVAAGLTRRIDAATVQTILHERARIKTDARKAIGTAEERRRTRAATAAGFGTIREL